MIDRLATGRLYFVRVLLSGHEMIRLTHSDDNARPLYDHPPIHEHRTDFGSICLSRRFCRKLPHAVSRGPLGLGTKVKYQNHKHSTHYRMGIRMGIQPQRSGRGFSRFSSFLSSCRNETCRRRAGDFPWYQNNAFPFPAFHTHPVVLGLHVISMHRLRR